MAKFQEFLIRLIFWGFRLLPVRWVGAFGAGLGRLLFLLLRKHRNNTLRNLARIYPDKTRTWRNHIARETFAESCRCVFELPHVLFCSKDFLQSRVEIEGLDAFHQAIAEGNGVLMMAGHLCSWELSGLMLSSICDSPHIIYTPLRQPRLNAILLEGRQRFGANFVSRLDGLRWLSKAVKAGDVITIMVDQHISTGIPVPFLGHLGNTSALPATFALRNNIPVFTLYLERIGHGFEFKLHIWPVELPQATGNKEADIYHIMSKINDEFAPIIHQRPEMWLWLHRRWLILDQEKENAEAVHGTP